MLGIAVYPIEDSNVLDNLWAKLPEEIKEIAAKVKLFANPKNFGYGGNQKAILRYALEKGFDRLLIFKPGQFDNETLIRVFKEAQSSEADVLLVNPDLAGLKNILIVGLINKILNLKLGGYSHAIRIYSKKLLGDIPFESNTDGSHFDAEIIIQARAAEAKIEECNPSLKESPRWTGEKILIRTLLSAIKYRLHQLHIWRFNNFLIPRKVRYSFKNSRYSSHMQIISAINEHSNVLDLGCSQGMLAEHLEKKHVNVTGVDIIPKEFVSKLCTEYYQQDIYKLEDLELKRNFDYLVFADVIEHIISPLEILNKSKRYLKPDGILIASTPNIAIWFYRLSLLLGRFEYDARGILDDTHVHLYTKASFKRLIEKAGFRTKRMFFTIIPFEIIFESTGRSAMIKFINWLYYQLVRIWPSFFAYQIIIEAEMASLEAAEGEGLVN